MSRTPITTSRTAHSEAGGRAAAGGWRLVVLLGPVGDVGALVRGRRRRCRGGGGSSDGGADLLGLERGDDWGALGVIGQVAAHCGPVARLRERRPWALCPPLPGRRPRECWSRSAGLGILGAVHEEPVDGGLEHHRARVRRDQPPARRTRRFFLALRQGDEQPIAEGGTPRSRELAS